MKVTKLVTRPEFYERARRIMEAAVTDTPEPPLIPCPVCGKDGWCGTHNDRNLDDEDDDTPTPRQLRDSANGPWEEK